MKLKKFSCLLSLLIFTLFTIFSYAPAQAAQKEKSIPDLKLVTGPRLQYQYGDVITFTVTSPNYSGKVEYRVLLYNGTTGKTSELWNNPKSGNYYTKWRPQGNYKFEIHWPVIQMEPGAYSLTVLVRRAGVRINYDSYINTKTFWITGSTRIAATINYSGGGLYSGEQKNNIPDGNGTMLWPNGDKYIGEFKNGLLNGRGTYIWSDGDRYKGEFKNDRRDGQGVMTWNNGDIYTGQFINDEMNGRGTFEWINGNKYIGEFKDGTITGYGTMIYANGNRSEGLWENAVLVNPDINPPGGLRTQVIMGNQIQIGWDQAANADCYYVYYSYSYNGPYYCLTDYDGKKTAYGWTSNYSAVISNVPYNTTVYVKVTAVKNGIESEYSNIASVTTVGEYYPYSYWYPYGYVYQYPNQYLYPYEYPYYHPYDLVIESKIYGYFTGLYYNKEYVLTNGQVWRQISNTIADGRIYMPVVLIYYIDASYIMWIEGINEAVYVEQVR